MASLPLARLPERSLLERALVRNVRKYGCCRELAVARAPTPQATREGIAPKAAGRTVSRLLLDRSFHGSETGQSRMGL